jgi:hypothetical protein
MHGPDAAQPTAIKEKPMKAFLKITLAALMLVLASVSWAQNCTNATIQGSYAFTLGGWAVLPNGYVQRDGVSMTQFDGQGNLTQVDWVMSNGQPMGGHSNQYGFHDGETGTYTVNPDCTGNAQIRFPPPQGHHTGAIINLMFVVGEQGGVIHTVVSSLTPPDGNQPVPADIRSDAHKVQ